ncbi:molybdopterin-dependent oxidoreductase [Halomonas urumqiensis]|uniref:Oxidoreductase n=1 Tax=Halomonas urumqiensis TaxID=1684789 RepID=A0A2N7UHB6_9GAMM|nr:molybdopterin-dependent oxidoreductase [Halomonas urumqiensis]PMR79824.1 oxidoreductase [Halomonas urumqiensis]PTB02148.1 oxidoreductase [Halomonas urumqiensis]GHE21605.1 oxidoreductase [Halomonas urumqiensis]
MRYRAGYLLTTLLLLTFMALPGTAASHGALPKPQGEVLLSISGDIAHANVSGEARFDRQMLMGFDSHEIHTHTPWHHDAGVYEGPLLRDVLAAAGVRSERIRVRALNDFEAEIPLTDLHDYDVILAMSRNGEWMQIREFGPLFVLYPFDAHPELMNETIRFRSVWQVVHIHAP